MDLDRIDNIQIEDEHAGYVVALIPTSNDTNVAYLTPMGDHWVGILWIHSPDVDGVCNDYTAERIDTAGWVEGDHLFLPCDGQSVPAGYFGDDQPDSRDNWYDPETGLGVLFDIAGSTMARLVN